ncbi:MAG: tRNA (adenosine(37)-N6)-dimethylallyltransferase MiaA [Lachnospiraceae bacterium]|nr:tRNA (adenosine(37)-N6)-dimethylallyltransferase MiaA [Lachnospiraceae bacterium]
MDSGSGEKRRQPLLVLTGPTAVGKTKLSIALAHALSGEIISADSMQVYRGMDIGTDKIRPEDMDGVPHHLIDVLDPTDDFHVYAFQKMALHKIDEIASRGNLPILVGGTGFYIQAVLYQVDFTDSEDGGAYRKELEERVVREGEDAVRALHEELRAVDPEAAEAIHAHNVKRVIRALEFHHLTGERISDHNASQRVKESPFDFLCFVLTDDRAKLYERINRRVDEMIAGGLEGEVRGLFAAGLTGDEVSMQGLGYRQMAAYLHGSCSFDEAVTAIKTETRHFAKRQITWFKRERDVRWLDRREFKDDGAILEEMLKQCKTAWKI